MTTENKIESISLGAGDNEPAIDPSSILGDANSMSGPGPSASVLKKQMQQMAGKRSREEITASQELITKINRYLTSSRFQQFLADNGFKQTPNQMKNMTIPELEELLQRVQSCVRNKTDSNLIYNGTFFVVNTVENLTQRPHIKEKVDLAGLSVLLQSNEQFLDALEEIRLELNCGSLNPYQRLALSLVTSAIVVNKANQLTKAQSQLMDQLRNPAPHAPSVPSFVACETDNGDESDPEYQPSDEEKEPEEKNEASDLLKALHDTALEETKQEQTRKKAGRPRKYGDDLEPL